MKNELLNKYFKEIKEKTGGDNTSCSDIIDYENGSSITKSEIEEEYYKYLDLQEEIDDYIEFNDLDDVKDEKTIKEHFQNSINIEYFELNQAVLKDFVSYMITKIEKEKLMQN